MTSVSYESIFNLFLGSITDYKLASLDESDAMALMTEYLHKSLAEPYVSRIFKNILTDDNERMLTYELAYAPNGDEANFVVNALSKWMVYEWLHHQVRSVVNTAQFFGGAEQKFYSQSNHLSELRALQDDAYHEARFYIQDRGWITNSYLGGS